MTTYAESVRKNIPLNAKTEIVNGKTLWNFYTEFLFANAINAVNDMRDDPQGNGNPQFGQEYISTTLAREQIHTAYTNALNTGRPVVGADGNTRIQQYEANSKMSVDSVLSAIRTALRPYATDEELKKIDLDYARARMTDFTAIVATGVPAANIASVSRLPLSPYDPDYGYNRIFLEHGDHILYADTDFISGNRVITEANPYTGEEPNTTLSWYTHNYERDHDNPEEQHTIYQDLNKGGGVLETDEDRTGVSMMTRLAGDDAGKEIIRSAFKTEDGKMITDPNELFGDRASQRNAFLKAQNILNQITNLGYTYTLTSTGLGTVDANVNGTGLAVRILDKSTPTVDAYKNVGLYVGRVYNSATGVTTYVTAKADGNMSYNREALISASAIPNLELRPLMYALGQPMPDYKGAEIVTGQEPVISANFRNKDMVLNAGYSQGSAKTTVIIPDRYNYNTSLTDNHSADITHQFQDVTLHSGTNGSDRPRTFEPENAVDPIEYVQNAITTSGQNLAAMVDVDGLYEKAQAFKASNDPADMPKFSDNDLAAKLQKQYWELFTGEVDTLKKVSVDYENLTGTGDDDVEAQSSKEDVNNAYYDPAIGDKDIAKTHLDDMIDQHFGHFDVENKLFDLNPTAIVAYASGVRNEFEFSDKLGDAIDQLKAKGVAVNPHDMVHGSFANAKLMNRCVRFDTDSARPLYDDDPLESSIRKALVEAAAQSCGGIVEINNVMIDNNGVIRGAVDIPRRQQIGTSYNGVLTPSYPRPFPEYNTSSGVITVPSFSDIASQLFLTNKALKGGNLTPERETELLSAKAKLEKFVDRREFQYGQIFNYDESLNNPDSEHIKAVVTHFFSGDNSMFIPKINAYYVSPVAGNPSSLADRLRVKTYDDKIVDKLRSQFASDLISRGPRTTEIIGKPYVLDTVTYQQDKKSFAVDETGDYMKTICRSGMTKEDAVDMLIDFSDKMRLPTEYIDSAGASAALHRKLDLENGYGRANDNFATPFAVCGNKNLAVIPDELNGIVDPVESTVAKTQGAVLTLAEGAKIDHETGKIIPTDGNGRSRLMNHSELMDTEHNPADRQNMAVSVFDQMLSADHHTGIAMMSLGGWGFNDAVVISKQYAEAHPAFNEMLNKLNALRSQDKLSDFNGNKGVTAIVIDPDMPLDVARRKGIEPLVEFFKLNPQCDVVMQPYSPLSRFNGGTLMNGLKEHTACYVPQVKLDTDNIHMVTDRNEDGTAKTKIVEGGIFFEPIGVLPQLGEAKTHLDKVEGRKASALQSWMYDSIPSPEIQKYLYQANQNLIDTRAYANLINFDLDEYGVFRQGIHIQKGEDPNLFTLPTADEINARIKAKFDAAAANGTQTTYWKCLNEVSNEITESVMSEMAHKGGYLIVPKFANSSDFAIKPLSDGTPFPTVEGAGIVDEAHKNNQIIPIVSSSIRSGTDWDGEGNTVSHDYDRYYREAILNLVTAEVRDANITNGATIVGDKYNSKDESDKFTRALNGANNAMVKMAANVKTQHFNSTDKRANVFRNELMSRMLPYSGTAPVSPNPNLNLDQIAIPYSTAKLFKLVDSKNMKEAIQNGELKRNSDGSYQIANPDSVLLVHRDPTWRVGARRCFNNIVINNDIPGIQVNPIIGHSMDMDYDGDTLGLVAMPGDEAKAARAEALDKWTMRNFLLEESTQVYDGDKPKWVVDEDGKQILLDGKPVPYHELNYDTGLDLKSGEKARPELADMYKKLEVRANQIEAKFKQDDANYNKIKSAYESAKRDVRNAVVNKLPPEQFNQAWNSLNYLKAELDKGKQYPQAQRDDIRQKFIDDMSLYAKSALAASFGADHIDFANKQTVADSLGACVADGAKGSFSKLKTALNIAEIDYDSVDEKTGKVVGVKDCEAKKPTTDKEALFAVGMKPAGTPRAGASESRLYTAVRNLGPDTARAASELGYLVNQAVLQAKKGPEKANNMYYNVCVPYNAMMRGEQIIIGKGGRWEPVKDARGHAVRIKNPQDWAKLYMAFMSSKEGFEMHPNPDFVNTLAKALTATKGVSVSLNYGPDSQAFLKEANNAMAKYGQPPLNVSKKGLVTYRVNTYNAQPDEIARRKAAMRDVARVANKYGLHWESQREFVGISSEITNRPMLDQLAYSSNYNDPYQMTKRVTDRSYDLYNNGKSTYTPEIVRENCVARDKVVEEFREKVTDLSRETVCSQYEPAASLKDDPLMREAFAGLFCNQALDILDDDEALKTGQALMNNMNQAIAELKPEVVGAPDNQKGYQREIKDAHMGVNTEKLKEREAQKQLKEQQKHQQNHNSVMSM